MLNWFKNLGKKNQDEKAEEYIEDSLLEKDQLPISEEEINQDILNDEAFEQLEDIIEQEEQTDEAIEELIEEIILEEEAEEEILKQPGFFQKLKVGLSKTRDDISNKIDGVLNSYKKIDEELFEDLEEVLITADVGVNTTMELIDRLRERIKSEKTKDPTEVKELLKDEIRKLMKESVSENQLNIEPSPAVILVVGVNGVGKTTTIVKLAAKEHLEKWTNIFNAFISKQV